MTLFADTELFTSGKLTTKSFDIPDADLKLYEHFVQRQEADQYYETLINETPWKQEKITTLCTEIAIAGGVYHELYCHCEMNKRERLQLLSIYLYEKQDGTKPMEKVNDSIWIWPHSFQK